MTERPKEQSRLYRITDACLGKFRMEVVVLMVVLGFVIGTELGYQTVKGDLEKQRPVAILATRTLITTTTASVTPTPTKVAATAVPVLNSVEVR